MGFRSSSYDVKLNKQDDILTRAGFFRMLNLMLGLVQFGIIVAGPPCSLFVAACASVHRRRADQVLGDQSRMSVRLGNQIWINVVALTKG
ncbi:WD_REPEATS_REGION domain-containing protein [Durusdinium trenchii]|uniref:WD_REPEATS_REGION domain-containing protein n=1 Tax=Durusdinium trenchii TaxID=1381693 RepID=A0ABP0MXK4_9DINO